VTGKHENPLTVESVVSEYVSRRAAELIDESDKGLNMFDAEAMGRWIGAATEILRELTHA